MLHAFSYLSVLLSGAAFGFFYAWVCSTMWGLDAGDPRIAIQAMQSMNASVRNAVFAPVFFGTPLVLLATTALAILSGQKSAGRRFAIATAVYLVGCFLVTVLVHIPMNEALALVSVPEDIQTARIIWDDYSPRWQLFNIVRTAACGAALLICANALRSVARY